jgi:dolichol-phosphate mannosyltransferase
MRILKYLVTGLIGISINLGMLHLFVQGLGVYYLHASIMAVSISTIVGFILQKYWTFADQSSERLHRQFILYVIIAIANIGINTLVVYVLSGVLHFHYLIGQFAGAAVVALTSFFLYRYVLFTPPEATIS